MNSPTFQIGQARLHLRHYYFGTLGRRRVEAFISKRFLDEHGAKVSEFMPHLLAAHNQYGQIVAASGIRSGADADLFLENYLDQPIETLLNSEQRVSIDSLSRKHIVEIGNLASTTPAASRFLFRQLLRTCRELDYRCVVFTACQRLCRSFRHLNLLLVKLADADETQLSNTLGQWGRYYQGKPSVMVGYLPANKVSMQCVSERGVSHV